MWLPTDPGAEPHGRPCGATIGYDAAQAILRSVARPLGVERVPLSRAGRRILAEPVRASVDAPRRDVSAMDGYAVRSADMAAGNLALQLIGDSVAGGKEPIPLAKGSACAISTGAPMPCGADRVIPFEQVQVVGETVNVQRIPAKPHVRMRASDFVAGTTLLQSGTHLDARAVLVAAAGDVTDVAVWRRPRVDILINGDEIVAAGTARASPTAVPDSLSEAILLMARQWGGKPRHSAMVRDDVDAISCATARMLGGCDILVIAGGASHGKRDLVRQAIAPLGLVLHFAGVAMKPGKPLWYGQIGRTHVIGLPGNPTAALTCARLFLAPLLSGMAGGSFDDALRWFNLPAVQDVEHGTDRDSFLCGTRRAEGVQVIDRQEASAQMMLAQADVLIERRSGAPVIAAGQSLRCLRL